MTSEIEKKRRELFGKWCDEQGHGRASTRRMLWPAFNDALDAVEIELPSKFGNAPSYACYEGGWNDMRDEAIDAITATGLGLRIK